MSSYDDSICGRMQFNDLAHIVVFHSKGNPLDWDLSAFFLHLALED